MIRLHNWQKCLTDWELLIVFATETFIATDEEVATSIQSLPSDEELMH